MAESQSRANLSSVAEQGTIGAREEGAGRVDYGGLDYQAGRFLGPGRWRVRETAFGVDSLFLLNAQPVAQNSAENATVQ